MLIRQQQILYNKKFLKQKFLVDSNLIINLSIVPTIAMY